MGSKRRPHPDHYQTAGKAEMDKDRYREEVKKLKTEESPEAHAARMSVGDVVHAGQLLAHPTAAVCTECEFEVGLDANVPVIPCQNCGCETFRVVE